MIKLSIEKNDTIIEREFEDCFELNDYILNNWDDDAEYWVKTIGGAYIEYRDLPC